MQVGSFVPAWYLPDEHLMHADVDASAYLPGMQSVQ
jgi:hypothetical protein